MQRSGTRSIGFVSTYLASDIPKTRRSAFTALRKDRIFDRFILDRRGPNPEEAHIARASQDLATGWRLTGLVLDADESLLLYSTDLCEMFFTFKISGERGAANCVAAEVPLRKVLHTKAARFFQIRYPGISHETMVFMSLFTEPMGDLNAVRT